MVRGLQLFREHFASYPNQYVLIGGTACSIIMENAGLEFRATKDLDIVLCIEVLDMKFIGAFWEFIKRGEYQNRLRSTGKEVFYRFDTPSSSDYPVMIELFSRAVDMNKMNHDRHLQHIKMDEAATSLSAILLNDDYYQFIHSGKCKMLELSILKASHLIPIKARAWLDLTEKKGKGIQIDRKDIHKHRNDVIHLYPLLNLSH